MKKTLIVAAALVLLGSVAFGQEAAPNLTAGSRAILFSFDNFNIGTFERNFGIGGKYYISDNLAARGRLSFVRASETIPTNLPSDQTGTEGEESAIFFAISPAIEWHIGSERVSPYLGGGLGFSYTTTEAKSVVLGAGPKATGTDFPVTIRGVTYQGGTGFDVFALVGAEFFLLEEVSLGAEYRLGFSSTFNSDQVVNSDQLVSSITIKQGSSNFIGFTTGAGLTLAIYF